VPVLPRLVVNTTDAAADAAAAGLGLTLLVSYQVAHHLADGRLVEVLAGRTRSPIAIHLVQPAGRFPPAKVRLFVDEIGRALRSRFA
jgi:DNA-binding transcriptional LysR family regulator